MCMSSFLINVATTKNLSNRHLNLLGRFDRLLYVGPPKNKDREDIFRVHLLRMACSSDVCISELSRLTEGYTGADISLICREGAIKAIDVRKPLFLYEYYS